MIDQSSWARRISGVLRALERPENMLFIPAITLAAFWLGGERMLIVAALGFPAIMLLAGLLRARDVRVAIAVNPAGTASRQDLATILDASLQEAATSGLATACLAVMIDDAEDLSARHGFAAQSEILARAADRIVSAMRGGDTVARLGGGGLAVALRPMRRLDLEAMVQIAARLQSALSAPFSVDGAQVYITASVGFCQSQRMPGTDGASLRDAAITAAEEALRNGPGAIRAYTADMARRRSDREGTRAALERALEAGEIRPWFQPQVSTDTGAITGFEALARWHHPERGLLPPSEFLPDIEEAGLSERLGEVILFQSLTALSKWDRADLRVPTVSVNFSATELRNPRLAEKLRWELDRFDLSIDRLCVEILENVVAQTENDVLVANIAALSRMGCGIDLDDFGVGHASITSIRRFQVRRIKIDRSFVSHMDEDRDQQRIVAAVLSMAEQLGLDTLAEGVETPGEHAMLAQLGCGHVQGYAIARPMPFDDTLDWIARHRAQVSQVARIGTRAR